MTHRVSTITHGRDNPWVVAPTRAGPNKEDNMAVAKSTEKKERKPARTIEERIAELQAKAEARQSKDRTKAQTALNGINDRIIKLESQLGDLYVARDAAMSVLEGDTADEVENPMVEEPTD